MPILGAVNVTWAQKAPFEIAELVEAEQRVVRRAAEMTIVGRAFLFAVGRALRGVHVQDDGFRLLALMDPVDPRPGEVGQRRQIIIRRRPLRLEAPHLTGRGRTTIKALAVHDDGTIYFIANAEGDFDICQLGPESDQPTLFNRSDADEWDPAVSPDGRWIAFASKRAGSWDIYNSPTNDSSKVQRVTDLPGQEWDPTRHPSGAILAFASKQTEESQIFGICFASPK